jgi:hypothetical protein
MSKNGNYQERMNKASSEAYKIIRDMKKRGERPPEYKK